VDHAQCEFVAAALFDAHDDDDDAACLPRRSSNPSVRTKTGGRDESEVIMLQACKTGVTEMVEQFMRARTPVDCVDEWGNSGLILAAMHGHTDVVDALLHPGEGSSGEELTSANPNTQNKWAGTALIEAAARGMVEIVQLLVESQVRSKQNSSR
jgi:ankyrin repeat protein